MTNIIQVSPRTLQQVNEASQDNNCQVSLCSRKIAIKRLFLPLAGTMTLVYYPIFQTYIYLPCFVFVTFFIIFWNFPGIITFMNSKPLYYEDLFVKGISETENINPIVRRKFENAFEWSLIFTNSLFTAALSEYWLYQTGSAQSYVEIIGVTGGILKIFQSINRMNGTILLTITRFYIDRELTNASKITQSGVAIELTDIGDTVPSIDNSSCVVDKSQSNNTIIHTNSSAPNSSASYSSSQDVQLSDPDSISVPIR